MLFRFTAVRLPDGFIAIGLADDGDVCGSIFDPKTGTAAARVHSGRVIKLAGMRNREYEPYNRDTLSWSDEAHTISSTGAIGGRVGWFLDGDYATWPMLWIGGTQTILSRLPAFDHYEVEGVNRHLSAVGSAWVSGRRQGYDFAQEHSQNPDARAAGFNRAILWDKGKLRDLGWGRLWAINDRNDFVGKLGSKATLWRDGKAITIATGIARAISHNGIVVGDEDSLQHKPGFLWQGGKRTSLPPLRGFAGCQVNGVHGGGWAVGECATEESRKRYEQHAVLWIGSTPHKLTSLLEPSVPIPLRRALAINNQRQILCEGDKGYFLLTPSG